MKRYLRELPTEELYKVMEANPLLAFEVRELLEQDRIDECYILAKAFIVGADLGLQNHWEDTHYYTVTNPIIFAREIQTMKKDDNVWDYKLTSLRNQLKNALLQMEQLRSMGSSTYKVEGTIKILSERFLDILVEGMLDYIRGASKEELVHYLVYQLSYEFEEVYVMGGYKAYKEATQTINYF